MRAGQWLGVPSVGTEAMQVFLMLAKVAVLKMKFDTDLMVCQCIKGYQRLSRWPQQLIRPFISRVYDLYNIWTVLNLQTYVLLLMSYLLKVWWYGMWHFTSEVFVADINNTIIPLYNTDHYNSFPVLWVHLGTKKFNIIIKKISVLKYYANYHIFK